MKIVGRLKLEAFKEEHPDAGSQIDSWVAEVEEAQWRTPLDVKQRYGSASILNDNHVVFNVKGNRYRLKVQIAYKIGVVLIKDVGTHQEYMTW